MCCSDCQDGAVDCPQDGWWSVTRTKYGTGLREGRVLLSIAAVCVLASALGSPSALTNEKHSAHEAIAMGRPENLASSWKIQEQETLSSSVLVGRPKRRKVFGVFWPASQA